MEEENLREYFSTLQMYFLKGEFQALEEFFALPLVVYTTAGVIVVREPEDLTRLVEQYRAALVALDVVETTINVQSFDQLDYSRRRVIVSYVDLNADGKIATQSLIRYFLVKTSERCKIEMMEYLESPLPRDDVERIIH